MDNNITLNFVPDVKNKSVILDITNTETNVIGRRILDKEAINNIASYLINIINMYDNLELITKLINNPNTIQNYTQFKNDTNSYTFLLEIPFVHKEHLPILLDDMKHENVEIRIQNYTIEILSKSLETLIEHITGNILPLLDTYINNM